MVYRYTLESQSGENVDLGKTNLVFASSFFSFSLYSTSSSFHTCFSTLNIVDDCGGHTHDHFDYHYHPSGKTLRFFKSN